MANSEFIVRNGLIVANSTTVSVTANSTGITANSFTGNGVNLTTLNATSISTGTLPAARLSGTYNITANNSSFLGGTAAASYQLNSTLAANVTDLTSFGSNTISSNTWGTMIDINSTTGNTALRVIQRNSGDAFRVDDIGGDITPFVIDTAGRMLHGHESNFFVGGNWGRQYHGNVAATIGTNHVGWGAAPSMIYTYSTNDTVANGVAPSLPANNQVFTQLARLYVHTNTDVYTESFRITLLADQESNGTAVPTGMNILTQNGTSTTLGTRYNFASNGNFGISTTSPTEKLHVVGNGLFSQNVTANLFSGNGASLTSLNATSISSGTLADARLSSNVVRSVTIVNSTSPNVGYQTINSISAAITNGVLTITVNWVDIPEHPYVPPSESQPP